MGKVIGPLHSIQVRGKVGEILFRRWRDINTVSGWANNPGNGNAQGLIAFRLIQEEWSFLDEEERILWNKYGRKKIMDRGPFKPKRRSGYITFCCNGYLAENCGVKFAKVPPNTIAPNFPEDLKLEEDVSGKYLISWKDDQDGDFIEIKGYLNREIGMRFYDDRLLILGYYSITTGSCQKNTVVAGKKGRIRGRIIRNSGQVGPAGFVTMIN